MFQSWNSQRLCCCPPVFHFHSCFILCFCFLPVFTCFQKRMWCAQLFIATWKIKQCKTKQNKKKRNVTSKRKETQQTKPNPNRTKPLAVKSSIQKLFKTTPAIVDWFIHRFIGFWSILWCIFSGSTASPRRPTPPRWWWRWRRGTVPNCHPAALNSINKNNSIKKQHDQGKHHLVQITTWWFDTLRLQYSKVRHICGDVIFTRVTKVTSS